MASAWDSMISGSAVGGASSGAAAGVTVGGPWGAAIGGVLGGIGGAYMDYSRDNANEVNKQTNSQIMSSINAMNRTSYKQHIADLNKALGFFAPAQQQWDMLYGRGTSPNVAQGTWANTAVK